MTGHSIVAVFAIFAGIASGQTAGVSGLILDPSNSPISGVEVNIRNEHTGGRRSTSSNTAGLYSLPSLSPGLYRLSIRAIDFETIVREGIKLETGENARMDFSLTLGDFRTEVTVHGDPPLINSANASVRTVIANYFTVDGVSANFALMNPLSSTPSGLYPLQAGGAMIPANSFLGTFSNLVSPAPEFGRSPGAQIGLVTRSGTNRYSGSLFEYFRNDKTDANDWFVNQQALPKPPLRFNDFGSSLGGPVRIPHLYDGHDRTFFFLSVKDLLMLQPQPPVSFRVPTLQARQNAPPLVAALLNAYPLPNRTSSRFGDPALTGFSEYAGAASLKQDQQTYGLRLDPPSTID